MYSASWSDTEIHRFMRRVEAMVQAGTYESDDGPRLGISTDEAEASAVQMLYRDRDLDDDRRVCFECRHLHGRKCQAAGHGHMSSTHRGFEPVRIVLQRCPALALRGKK